MKPLVRLVLGVTLLQRLPACIALSPHEEADRDGALAHRARSASDGDFEAHASLDLCGKRSRGALRAGSGEAAKKCDDSTQLDPAPTDLTSAGPV
jgi:hypothetical protein